MAPIAFETGREATGALFAQSIVTKLSAAVGSGGSAATYDGQIPPEQPDAADPRVLSAVLFQQNLTLLFHSLKDILLTIAQWWAWIRSPVN
jgi:hypothetical protein